LVGFSGDHRQKDQGNHALDIDSLVIDKADIGRKLRSSAARSVLTYSGDAGLGGPLDIQLQDDSRLVRRQQRKVKI
jgi:hypothetical protein